jgi:hypothetical protein
LDRRRGPQGDDFVTVQRFEEWLEAADDEAAHGRGVDLDVADAGRPLDSPPG